MEWISMKEQLPEPYEKVIGYYCQTWNAGKPEVIDMVIMDHKEEFISEADNGSVEPTHWQPLPPPPSSHNSDYAKCSGCKDENLGGRCLMCSRNFKDEYN